MKTYSVNEISNILKTNPETVRRWIRLGKLKANQASRKGGNEITEQNLREFLKTSPKYSKIAGTSIGLAVASFFNPILLPIALSNIAIFKKEFLINNSQIPIVELEKCIEEYIKNSTNTITLKKEEIKNIQQEINDEENKIVELEKFLTEIRSQNNNVKSK